MEAAGGINEIYNFYVGKTLQNSLNQATASFSSTLGRAQATDYTSINAINSKAYVTQGQANGYINAGAAAALRVGSWYGCTPGALTLGAVASFARDVNAAKDTTNTRIANVQAGKYAQYTQYQAYLAYMAEVAAWEAAWQAVQPTEAELRAEAMRRARLGRMEQQLYKMHPGSVASTDIRKPAKVNPAVPPPPTSPYDNPITGFTTGMGAWVNSIVGIIEGGSAAGGVPYGGTPAGTMRTGAVGLGLVLTSGTVVLNAIDSYRAGNDLPKVFRDAIVNSAWDIELMAISFIPGFGPFIAIGLLLIDIATDGALSRANNELVGALWDNHLEYRESPYYLSPGVIG
jgi:hypothetical protein